MNFKQWLLSEEVYPQNKTATVFHRTCTQCDADESVKSVSNILTSDFKSGSGVGCVIGCGLYTTFAIESQFDENMSAYGKAVIKFKVTELDKYLIFQLSVAKSIHGNDYKISDQLNKLGVLNKANKDNLKNYDLQQEKNDGYSMNLAKLFWKENQWIENSIKGIMYRSEGDGFCLLKYEPVQDGTIAMLGYAVAEYDDKSKMEELKANKGWITSTDKASIKSIAKSSSSDRSKFSIDDNSNLINDLLKSNTPERIASKFNEKISQLSDKNILFLLSRANNKDQIANIIINHKPNLSDDNVRDLIQHATNKEQIAKLLKDKIQNLKDYSVANLLANANSRSEMVSFIVNHKTNLSDSNVKYLIQYANDKNKIANVLKYKQNLSDDNISDLLSVANNKDQMANFIFNKNRNISYYIVDKLIQYAADKPKFAQTMNQYHTNKTPEIQKLINGYLGSQTVVTQ